MTHSSDYFAHSSACSRGVGSALAGFVCSLSLGTADLRAAESTLFAPSWESLRQHYHAPEWYRDAKFGIFMHWGPCSVPAGANDGWYGRNMYMQHAAPWGHAYDFHVKNYGHPSQVGYKDIIPRWRAERWNPDELVAFYKHVGARYVVPVAVHHDNFDCYASSHQPWNSVNVGPKRDVVGEWRQAILKAGMHFGVSSHSDRAPGWWETAFTSDTDGPLKGVPYDGILTKADGLGKWWSGFDPQELYVARNPNDKDAFAQHWYLRTMELVDKYQPELLYFDGGLPMGQRGLQVAADLYNQRVRNGRTQAVITVKWNPDLEAAVDDQEKGLADAVRPQPWQLDASINNMWFADDLPLELTAKQIIDTLVDTVSKNGNLLLNVALSADGTLPDEQRRRLEEVGAWLSRNGEAIYGSRPTLVFGEGPTHIRHWQSVDAGLPNLTAEDVRYTTKDGALYAIVMGTPVGGVITLRSLRSQGGIFSGQVHDVECLGVGRVPWAQKSNGLVVDVPRDTALVSASYGLTLKVTGLTGLERDGVVRPMPDGTMRLAGWDAKLNGRLLRVLSSSGSVGDWRDADEYPSWEFVCPKAGTYELTARYAAEQDGAKATVLLDGTPCSPTWSLAKTSSLDDLQVVLLGSVTFPSFGRHTLSVRPVPGSWNSARLAHVQLRDPVIAPSADGTTALAIDDASRHGTRFFLQATSGVANLGGWTRADEWVSWDQVRVPQTGVYEVALEVMTGGSERVRLTIGEAGVEGALPSCDKFTIVRIGTCAVTTAGTCLVAVRPVDEGWHWMNLARVLVRPVRGMHAPGNEIKVP